MPLRGDLASFSLAEIFQSLSLNQSSGTLMVSDGENRSHLFFSGGQIIPLTQVPLQVSGLDRFLVKNSILTTETLEEIRSEPSEESNLVEELVRRNIAREDD
ncbi:MAG: DUF4388 domain-containing protein, partial [Planctomycetota bacterium]